MNQNQIDTILIMLKADLQISAPQYDEYLMRLITFSADAIEREGIRLEDTTEDNTLIEMYTAFLYRKRRESVQVMPRMLRWNLNNRLMSQKARREES